MGDEAISDRVVRRGRKIEIHSPGVPPFRVGKEHTVYEWTMIYVGRHPYPAHLDRELLKAQTVAGMRYRLRVLGASEEEIDEETRGDAQR